MIYKKAVSILVSCIVFVGLFSYAVFSDGYSDEVLYTQSLAISDNSIMNEVGAESAILIETKTNTVIAEKNPEISRPVSHLAKLMTILITAENIETQNLSLEEMVTVSSNANSKGSPQIWLDVGEKISVDELLKSITIGNANDACTALAEKIGGSEEKFVDMMNKKAKELGMNNTAFSDCTGLSENTVSSAYDLSILTSELLKHNSLTQYFTTWIDNVRNKQVELVNTNRLIRTYNGCNGVKSCASGNSGDCLVATAKRGNMELCVILLGSENDDLKFSDAKAVMDYGFTSFEIYEPELDDEMLSEITVNNGEKLKTDVKLDNLSNVLIPKGTYSQISCEYERKDNVDAPVKCNDKIGDVTFKQGDKIILKSNIVIGENVNKISLWFAVKRILFNLLYI